jgi:Zn-dependent protease
MADPSALAACPQCGGALPSLALACPSCGALVHAAELKRLAADAQAAEARSDRSAALASWRSALALLPPGTRQHATLHEKVVALSRSLDEKPATPWRSTAGAAAALLVSLLAKAKLLVAGLAKASTLWSMLLAFGVYWTAFGYKFALGLVVTIYVHEMGHVFALRRYGIAATAPMFIPGFGALVRLNQHPATVEEDAQVGLAGPRWGLFASFACWGAALAFGWPSWTAIARTSAFINLFNLLPLGSLDGGRAFRALSRAQRGAVAVSLALLWLLASEGLLLLLAIVAVLGAASRTAPETGSRRALVEYLVLAGALTFAATLAR